MAQVDIILEIITHSLNHYHRLTEFPVTIGRALDNDIILSDATVSSHHLEIDLDEDGQLVLRNLSSENGSKVNRQPLREQPVTVKLDDNPVRISLGSRRARLLRSDMDVGQTSVRNCSGLYVLFCKPVWSVILMVLTMLAFLSENYLQTMYEKDVAYYLSDLMPYMLIMIGLTLLVAGISRLSIQRWEVGAALSLVALIMLGPHVLGELGHMVNYFFTATWPMGWLVLLSNFLLLPVLFYAYMRLVHHSEIRPAIGVALLFSAPVMLFQLSDFADRAVISGEFTGEAEFSRELSSFDIRLAPTLSVDDFIARTEGELKETVRSVSTAVKDGAAEK
ncbi:MAG: FHA domain-containing protein [Thiolinea sp.]